MTIEHGSIWLLALAMLGMFSIIVFLGIRIHISSLQDEEEEKESHRD